MFIYEKGVFTTLCDYIQLHSHIEMCINILHCMYYDTFCHYNYIINKVYYNGKDCGYTVISVLMYRVDLVQFLN